MRIRIPRFWIPVMAYPMVVFDAGVVAAYVDVYINGNYVIKFGPDYTFHGYVFFSAMMAFFSAIGAAVVCFALRSSVVRLRSGTLLAVSVVSAAASLLLLVRGFLFLHLVPTFLVVTGVFMAVLSVPILVDKLRADRKSRGSGLDVRS